MEELLKRIEALEKEKEDFKANVAKYIDTEVFKKIKEITELSEDNHTQSNSMVKYLDYMANEMNNFTDAYNELDLNKVRASRIRRKAIGFSDFKAMQTQLRIDFPDVDWGNPIA